MNRPILSLASRTWRDHFRRVSALTQTDNPGYRYVSREFSRIEAISVGTHGLSAVKVHNCGGFAGPESGGVGWHYGSTGCSSSSLSSRSATVV